MTQTAGQTRWKVQGFPTSSPNLVNFDHKLFKTGPEFLPTLSILFHSRSIARAQSGINVHVPYSESKWNGVRFVCSSNSKPKILTWQWHHVGRPMYR